MTLFWIAFLITFALAVTYPIAVWTTLPASTKPTRWIQNSLPFSVFMLSSFPIAVGVFCVTFVSLQINVFDVNAYGSGWKLVASVVALVIMLAFASAIVLHDFISRPIGPYILRGERAAQAFQLEHDLRNSSRSGVPMASVAEKCTDYQNLIQLGSLSNVFRHGNWVAAAYLIIAWSATLFCVFYFWFVAVLVISNQAVSSKDVTRLLMVFVLLITWFPMRVHLDWYQNHFHCENWLKQSHAFWLGLVMAIASLLFVVFISRPEALVVFCTGLNAAVLAFVGLTGKFRPEWLRSIADFLQTTPFIYFAAAYTIFLFLVSVISLRVLQN